ncbi:MAG: hypothetical protein F6J98_03010 [Moorea sp. SIO4G2]|nr:hypothetical protein [Moorena sp. SIO4G2]
MLDNLTLANLACRASNLSERIAIIQQLSSNNSLSACTTPLTLLDNWMLEKMAGKLATVQVKQEIYQPLASHIFAKDNLQQLLIDYKLYERNLANLSESDLRQFVQPHSTWLNVYQAALATLDFPSSNFAGSFWYDPNIYYKHFAKVIEPFLCSYNL